MVACLLCASGRGRSYRLHIQSSRHYRSWQCLPRSSYNRSPDGFRRCHLRRLRRQRCRQLCSGAGRRAYAELVGRWRGTLEWCRCFCSLSSVWNPIGSWLTMSCISYRLRCELHFALFLQNHRPCVRKRGANFTSAPRLKPGLDGDTAGEDPPRLIISVQTVRKNRA